MLRETDRDYLHPSPPGPGGRGNTIALKGLLSCISLRHLIKIVLYYNTSHRFSSVHTKLGLIIIKTGGDQSLDCLKSAQMHLESCVQVMFARALTNGFVLHYLFLKVFLVWCWVIPEVRPSVLRMEVLRMALKVLCCKYSIKLQELKFIDSDRSSRLTLKISTDQI